MKAFSVYLSFLDLMCCGLGSTLLLFLLVAASVPDAAPAGNIPNATLLVRCSADLGMAERPEIKLLCKRPDDKQMIPVDELVAGLSRAGSGEAFTFGTRAGEKKFAECVFVHSNPQGGVWEFQPTVVTHNGVGKPGTEIVFDFHAVGERAIELGKAEPSPKARKAKWPGDLEPVFRVQIRAGTAP